MLQEKELSMSGRNWGDAVIDGSTLVFNVAGKPAFRIPLTDVGQVSCRPCIARQAPWRLCQYLLSQIYSYLLALFTNKWPVAGETPFLAMLPTH